MARRTRLATERVRCSALLLRKIAVGDADLIVHLLTPTLGRVAAIAPQARRSTKRFAGLEPLHGLRVTLELVPGRGLSKLREVVVEQPRVGLLQSLGAMDAAGRILGWVRNCGGEREPDEMVWNVAVQALTQLDGLASGKPEANELDRFVAFTGLGLLAAAGWALGLDGCVRCQTPCPSEARVRVDIGAGGVVCRDCGAGGVIIDVPTRAAMIRGLAGEAFAEEHPIQLDRILHLLSAAFTIHTRGGAT